MTKHEQLSFPLSPSLREGILPYAFAISELKLDLVGKRIRIVRVIAGKRKYITEDVLFMGISGDDYHTAVEFCRLEDDNRESYDLAGSSSAISKISFIGNNDLNQGVIYRNPFVWDYYRRYPEVSSQKGNELFLKGRWFPPKFFCPL
jgi:hypothetical protein